MTGEDEPNILFDEIKEVVNAMKKFKAPGCNSIEAELWQALGGSGIKAVKQLCTVILHKK